MTSSWPSIPLEPTARKTPEPVAAHVVDILPAVPREHRTRTVSRRYVMRTILYTVEFTERRAGKVAAAGTRAISRDGKVMTITSKGTDAKGQAVSTVLVFEKR